MGRSIRSPVAIIQEITGKADSLEVYFGGKLNRTLIY